MDGDDSGASGDSGVSGDSDFSDDGALLEALRAGDEDAFAWLLDRYDDPLHRLARSFVASATTADEVVPETWLAVAWPRPRSTSWIPTPVAS